MEQKNISLEEVYHRLITIEKALKNRGITIEINEGSKVDDEGEMTDEFKAKLEKARQYPESEYISHEEVKKRILNRKR